MYPERSILSDEFLAHARDWIRARKEIFAVIRFSHMAGSKDHYFFSEFEAYHSMLRSLSKMADVILFRDKQLPYRGTAGDDLKSLVKPLWRESEEWTMVSLAYNVPLRLNGWNANLWEIDEAFADLRGQTGACGPTAP